MNICRALKPHIPGPLETEEANIITVMLRMSFVDVTCINLPWSNIAIMHAIQCLRMLCILYWKLTFWIWGALCYF